MAIITPLSLDAIAGFKGKVVFVHNKGRIIARSRPLHFPKVRSPRVMLTANRLKIACYYLKTLSQDVIDLYRIYTDHTDWTWKDAFMSFFLNAWHANNAPPHVVTHLAFSWSGADPQLDFKFADWYYGFDFGYGTDGYGTCPYGTPTDLTVDQPHPRTLDYKFGFMPEVPRPY